MHVIGWMSTSRVWIIQAHHLAATPMHPSSLPQPLRHARGLEQASWSNCNAMPTRMGCDRCRCQVVQRELIQTREVDIHPIDVHCYLGKARFSCETFQFLSGRCLPRCAKATAVFVAHKWNKSTCRRRRMLEVATFLHTLSARRPLQQSTRRISRNASALSGGTENPRLAKNHVEAFSLQSKIDSAPHKPLDRCTNRCWERLRDLIIPGFRSSSDNWSGGTDTLRRHSSNESTRPRKRRPTRAHQQSHERHRRGKVPKDQGCTGRHNAHTVRPPPSSGARSCPFIGLSIRALGKSVPPRP